VFARRPARAKGRKALTAATLVGSSEQQTSPSRTSSTVDEEVRGGICRYEIRFSFESQSVQSTFVNAGSYHQARETFERLFPATILISIIYQGPSGELNYPVQPVSEISLPPSQYLFVSHMGANDSNSKWFDLALKAFQERYPNVAGPPLQPSEQKRDVKQEQHGENRCQQLVNPLSSNDRRNDRRDGEDHVKLSVQSIGQMSAKSKLFRCAEDHA
jgi:hypothetical protein